MKCFDFPSESYSHAARSGLRIVGLAIVAALLSMGCGDYGGSETDSSIVANSFGSGLPQGLAVAEQVTSFETTVYPLLRSYCVGCHAAGGAGSPKIADANPTAAWAAVVDNQKVNFSSPPSSRLVRRLAVDFHNCWTDCGTASGEMLTEILAWQTAIQVAGGTTGGVDVADLVSDVRTVDDGQEEVGDERAESGMIARWDFKELSGLTAFDTSGVAPAMDLSLEGPELMTSYGINIQTGRAIATADSSRKLYDRIGSSTTGSQQYTLELWIANANTTQEGPARIMSYSRNGGSRNFMLGQQLYQYAARNRTFGDGTNNNGTPQLVTYDVDQDAQSTLQHVVVTYNLATGRRIYVDGRWTDDLDEVVPGRLWNWDPSHRLVFGDEVNGGRQWIGQVRFAAIYARSMSNAEVKQNYDAGIGKRVTLAFDVSPWTGGNSSIEFSLTQLDDYSYLFCAPTFVSDTGGAFRIQNMRISINGVVPVAGQGFTRLDALVTSGRQLLSRQCSIIGGAVDPLTDEFQLVFEQLGIFQDPVFGINPTPGTEVFGDPVPVLGVRTYDRVNASMAAVSGVDMQTSAVDTVYDQLIQQLPGSTSLQSFVSANQVGVAKLGTEYCDALVGDGTPATQGQRDVFFPNAASFNWDAAPAVAFANPAEVDFVTDPLLDQIIGAGMRGDVMGSPARDQVEAILDQLIVDLSATCGGATEPPCDGDYTKSIVKGLCASVISSGALHIH